MIKDYVKYIITNFISQREFEIPYNQIINGQYIKMIFSEIKSTSTYLVHNYNQGKSSFIHYTASVHHI